MEEDRGRERTKVRLPPMPLCINVRSVALGANGMLLLSSRGELFHCGDGRGGVRRAPVYEEVKFQQVAVGAKCSLALSTCGEVWRMERSGLFRAMRVSDGPGGRVVSFSYIAARDLCEAGITEDGRVFGCNPAYTPPRSWWEEPGRFPTSAVEEHRQEIRSLRWRDWSVEVQAGSVHFSRGATFLISKNGDVFVQGRCSEGAAGTGRPSSHHQQFVPCSLPKKAVHVSSSGSHTVFLMEDGSVWGCRGKDSTGGVHLLPGRIAADHKVEQLEPLWGREPIVSIATSPHNTSLVTADGKLYTNGRSKAGPPLREVMLPEKVSAVHRYEAQCVVLLRDGSIMCKGNNRDMKLGLPKTEYYDRFEAVRETRPVFWTPELHVFFPAHVKMSVEVAMAVAHVEGNLLHVLPRELLFHALGFFMRT